VNGEVSVDLRGNGKPQSERLVGGMGLFRRPRLERLESPVSCEHVDRGDLRRRGTFARPSDDLLERLRRSGHDRFDGSVSAVAHAAAHAQSTSLLDHRPAVADSLDDPDDFQPKDGLRHDGLSSSSSPSLGRQRGTDDRTVRPLRVVMKEAHVELANRLRLACRERPIDGGRVAGGFRLVVRHVIADDLDVFHIALSAVLDSRVEHHHVVPTALVPADLGHLQSGYRLSLLIDLFTRRRGQGSPDHGEAQEKRGGFRTESLAFDQRHLIPRPVVRRADLWAGIVVGSLLQ